MFCLPCVDKHVGDEAPRFLPQLWLVCEGTLPDALVQGHPLLLGLPHSVVDEHWQLRRSTKRKDTFTWGLLNINSAKDVQQLPKHHICTFTPVTYSQGTALVVYSTTGGSERQKCQIDVFSDAVVWRGGVLRRGQSGCISCAGIGKWAWSDVGTVRLPLGEVHSVYAFLVIPQYLIYLLILAQTYKDGCVCAP